MLEGNTEEGRSGGQREGEDWGEERELCSGDRAGPCKGITTEGSVQGRERATGVRVDGRYVTQDTVDEVMGSQCSSNGRWVGGEELGRKCREIERTMEVRQATPTTGENETKKMRFA